MAQQQKQQTLDYRRPIREKAALPWCRTDLAPAAVTAAIILAANGWLLWNADKSWGFWLWVFLIIPVANGVLTAVLLACSDWRRGCQRRCTPGSPSSDAAAPSWWMLP
jgi:hypothetical protein